MTATMKLSRQLGLAGFFGLVVAAVAMGGNADSFFNGPAMLFVGGGTVALLVLTFGGRGCLAALRSVAGFRDHTAPRDGGTPAAFFRMAALYAVTTGFVGMLIGVVQILTAVDDMRQLGSGLAMTLLTLFYGAMLATPCIAFAAILRIRRPDS